MAGRNARDVPGVTRERILAEAAQLFRERGYEKTSVKVLGERLGVTAPALYYHFPSKEDILFAYLESGLATVLERTEEAISAERPSERLGQLVRTYVLFDLGELPGSGEYAAGVYGYFQLVEALAPEQRRRLDKLQRSYLDLIRSIVRDGIEAGEFDPIDVTAASFAISGMVMDTFHWFRPDGRLGPEQVADLLADLAVRMLETRT